jgi:hypothetical protein
MRKLINIIEDVKDGKKPEYEELRFALLAYNALLYFANKDVETLTTGYVSDIVKEFRKNANYTRHQKALNADPQLWMGNENPDLPEYQRQRKLGQGILNKVLKERENDGMVK